MNSFLIVILTVYLIYNSYTDIKNHTVPFLMSALFGITALIIQIGCGMDISQILLSFLPGIFVLFIACITRQSIGYGDGIILLVAGIVLGCNQTLLLLLFALVLSAFVSLYLITRHKSGKYTLPFVPFILCSYILMFFTDI